MTRLTVVLWAVLAAREGETAGAWDSVGQVLLRHMSKGISDAKPGDWISYRTDGGGGRVSFWRLSVVGQEKDSVGRDAVWVEIEMGEHAHLVAPLAQMRMLVARDGGLAADGITRVFVALGADKPQEVSRDELALLVSHSSGPTQSRARADEAGVTIRAGRERPLMTQAGTFPSVPIEIFQGGNLIKRLWLSYRLPLLHLARLEIPAIGHAMEVNGFGDDARPKMVLPAADEPKIHLEGLRTRSLAGAP